MHIKSLLLATAALAVLATPVMAKVPAKVSADVGFTSDYVFRGISQTDETAALQGGFSVQHDNGIHAGVWGSNIDFNNDDAGSIETDVTVGFANEIGGLSYDVGAIYYAYPGSEGYLNYDYWEAYMTASYDFEAYALNAGVYWSPEFFGETGDAVYYTVGVDVPLPYEVLLSAHVGRQEIDEGNDYSDWSLGFSKNWLEFDWAVTYTDTDIKNDPLADDRVVFSVSKSF